MTVEKHLEHLLAIMDSMPDDTCGDWRDSLAYAIDAIEQDIVPFDFELYQAGYMDMPKEMTKVLDAIKAEIIARDKNVKSVRTDGRCLFTAEEILGIIDKYRGK